MTDFELSPLTITVDTMKMPEVEQDVIFHDMDGPTFTDLLGDHNDMMDLFVSPIATSTEPLKHQMENVMKMMQENQQETTSSGRGWTIVASKLDLKSLSIKLKTRRDAPTDTVPEKMYSSLKYEVHLTAIGESIRKSPFLLARASVVDSVSLEKVTVTTGSVLKGDVEASMSKVPNGPNDMVKGTLKIQLNSELSYHHEKRLLCLVVEFFEPDSLDSPVIISRSACVKCYARKPNKKHPKSKKQEQSTTSAVKRKHTALLSTTTTFEEEEASKRKKKKIDESSTTTAAVVDDFSSFKSKLDDLMSTMTYSEEVRSMCMNYMFEKFVLADPGMARKVLLPSMQPFAAMTASQPEQFLTSVISPPVLPEFNFGNLKSDDEQEDFTDEFLSL